MMDSEVSVLLDSAAWRGLLESQVQVELSERFNRQTDEALERQIEEVWTERVSKELWLFNGSKFRLHSFCLASSSSSVSPKYPPSGEQGNPCSSASLPNTAQNGLDQRNRPVNQAETNQTARVSLSKASSSSTCDCRGARGDTAEDQEARPLLTLRLGLTCYKDYLGTNWSSRVAELRGLGEERFGDPLALLAQPLGVGAVLCTADGQVVLIRRSQKVAEAGGLLDIPGGHPEPKVVCERLGHEVCEEGQIRLDMMQQRAVVSELFSSVCAEIRDEINIPLCSLGEPVLMGIALNHTSAGRPSAEFLVSCTLTSDEVSKLYWKGGAEASESTDIVFLSRTDVLQLDGSSSLWPELCPSAKGAVLLYQKVKPEGEQGPNIRLIKSENGSS